MTRRWWLALAVSHAAVFAVASTATYQCSRHLRWNVWPTGWRWEA